MTSEPVPRDGPPVDRDYLDARFEAMTERLLRELEHLAGDLRGDIRELRAQTRLVLWVLAGIGFPLVVAIIVALFTR